MELGELTVVHWGLSLELLLPWPPTQTNSVLQMNTSHTDELQGLVRTQVRVGVGVGVAEARVASYFLCRHRQT